MPTVADFKAVFAAYMERPEEARDEKTAQRLKENSEKADLALAAAEKKHGEVQEKLRQATEAGKLSGTAGQDLESLQAGLIPAFETGNYAEAGLLLAEIEALVSDAMGETTGALGALHEARALEGKASGKREAFEANLAGLAGKAKEPEAAGKAVETVKAALAGLFDRKDYAGALALMARIEGGGTDGRTPEETLLQSVWRNAPRGLSDRKAPELKELMEKRAAAVSWQQGEIKLVDTAKAELARLDGVWRALHGGIGSKRGILGAAQGDLAQADTALGKSDETIREAVETRQEAEAGLQNQKLEKRWEAFRKNIASLEREIADEQVRRSELVRQQAECRRKVDDAQRELDREVDEAKNTLAAAAASLAEPLPALGPNAVPVLDLAGLKTVDAEPEADALKIEAIFPELKLVAGKHGTGRHGTQTGLENQAARAASRLSPDQKGNEGGLSRALYGADDSTLSAHGDVYVSGQEQRFEGTPTASLFLSPELEKQAVDRAIALVTAQCRWEEVEDGGKWQKLTNVMVQFGKPDNAPGWGVAISRITGDGKLDPAVVTRTLEDFRRGTIDFDALLKRFDTKMGETPGPRDAAVDFDFVKGVGVALNRVGGKWINTTQYPMAVAPGDVGWSLKDKNVRTGPVTAVAPALVLS